MINICIGEENLNQNRLANKKNKKNTFTIHTVVKKPRKQLASGHGSANE